MKRILYYTARDMSNPSFGINKKIINQISALRKQFYVDAVYRKNDKELILQQQSGEEKVLVAGMRRPYKIAASRGLDNYLRDNSYDGAYIRYVFADMQFHKVLKRLRKSDTKIVVEIPTYPYDAEMLDSLENRIVLLLDKMYRNRMKKYVDKVATYSQDDFIYNIPTIKIVNGVDFKKISRVVHGERQDEISIIAVADMAKWHGYDRFIEGMGKYYQIKRQRNIHFYIVGDGKERQDYEKIVKKYGIQDKVTFCGELSGKGLDDIYSICTLAVECLGLHRKGLTLSSSLKSREYAAKGLPIITSAKIDVFDRDYPYVIQFSEDEESIDMEKVISFHESIYSREDSNEVANKIRRHAQSLCDMDIAMKPITVFLSKE